MTPAALLGALARARAAAGRFLACCVAPLPGTARRTSPAGVLIGHRPRPGGAGERGGRPDAGGDCRALTGDAEFDAVIAGYGPRFPEEPPS